MEEFQHTQDHTSAFENLFTNINVVRLDSEDMIFSEYQKALMREDCKSTLLIEYGEYY